MRTGKIAINGKEYLLCFSARTMRNFSERYGGLENMDKVMTDGTEVEQLDESIWQLKEMLEAGNRYAKLEGLENPEPPSTEDLYDLCDIGDFTKMKERIFESITESNKREVEVEQGKEKNATTTQKDSHLGGTYGMD